MSSAVVSRNPMRLYHEEEYNKIVARIADIRQNHLWETANDDERAMMVADPMWVLDIIEERLKEAKK